MSMRHDEHYVDALAASANLYMLLESSVERAALKKLESAAKIQKFEFGKRPTASFVKGEDRG